MIEINTDTKSTRNESFNSYTKDDVFYSFNGKTLTGSQKNYALVGYDDAILKSGSEIISDLASNKALKGVTPSADGIQSNVTYEIYGAPYRWVLDNRQQYGNCGVVSALNILVMAGIKTISDQDKVETAFTQYCLNKGFCEDENNDGIVNDSDGGVTASDIEDILSDFKVTTQRKTSLDDVAQSLKNGCGVIMLVASRVLWGFSSTGSIDHAINVLGVVYNGDNIEGFYIHDTGAWMTRYISYDDFLNVATGKTGKDKTRKISAIVTTEAIKAYSDNTNIVGNSYSNILYGNNSANTLKGMAGNDTLYGRGGNDTLYGGI